MITPKGVIHSSLRLSLGRPCKTVVSSRRSAGLYTSLIQQKPCPPIVSVLSPRSRARGGSLFFGGGDGLPSPAACCLSCRAACGIPSFSPAVGARKSPASITMRGFIDPGGYLLSRDLSSDYHRRANVSLPGSGWGRVGPLGCDHQVSFDALRAFQRLPVGLGRPPLACLLGGGLAGRLLLLLWLALFSSRLASARLFVLNSFFFESCFVYKEVFVTGG